MKIYLKASVLALLIASIGIAFASRDGSGTYTLPAGNPVNTGTPISSTWANNTLSDIATALTNSLAKDGQTVPTANLPMGAFKHTNVANATARNNYASAGQIQDFSLQQLGSVAGTNTITGSLTPAITAYTDGMLVSLQPANTNTDAVTLAVSGLAATLVNKYVNGTSKALIENDLIVGVPAYVTYDASANSFRLLNPLSGELASGVLPSDLARLSQSNVFTSTGSTSAPNVGMTNGTPTIAWKESDATADNRNWYINASSEAMQFFTGNDADNVFATWLAVNRTGTTVDSINLQATSVQVNGQSIRDGAILTSVPSSGVLSSGTYTPTASDLSGLDSVTPGLAMWSRVGPIVTVSGIATVDPSATGTVQFNFSLPVASSFSGSSNLSGVGQWASDQGSSARVVRIIADATADLANLRMNAGITASETMTFTFQYQVL